MALLLRSRPAVFWICSLQSPGLLPIGKDSIATQLSQSDLVCNYDVFINTKLCTSRHECRSSARSVNDFIAEHRQVYLAAIAQFGHFLV